MKKQIPTIILVHLLCFFTCCGKCYSAEKSKEYIEINKPQSSDAVIETTYGAIEIKLYPSIAPNHVRNFTKLAGDGFYDGTIFHRVIPGFMIQGGDPNTKSIDKSTYGVGGPGYMVKAEFNKTSHKRGILSMARSSDPNSAGSQFFIVIHYCPVQIFNKHW